MNWRSFRAPAFSSLLRLALPLIVVNLGQQLMGVVDTALAGRIDDLSQAAAGLGNSIFMLGAIFGIGVTMGVDPLASQAFGANRPDRARKAMWQGVYAGVAIAIPLAGFIIFGVLLLESFGISADLAASTRSYIYARLPSLLPMFVYFALRSYLQSAHLPRAIVATTLVANLVNLAADWVLIFGDEGLRTLGLPAMGLPSHGVAGIGWATTVSVALQMVLLAWAVKRIPGKREHRPHRLDVEMMRQVFRVGVPIGFQISAELGIFTLVALLAGTMGTVAMAAHQVAIMLSALVFMVALALGTATSIEVGRAIGRRDPEATRQAGFGGISLVATLMVPATLAFWIVPEALARIMSAQPEVVELAIDLIRIAGAFQLFDGIQAVGSGAMRGAGMTRWAMGVNILAYWMVALPVAALLAFRFEMGPTGLWWGLTAGLLVAAVVLTARFNAVSRRPIPPLQSR